MPYTIKPGSFKYKKSNGQFSEIDCFEGPESPVKDVQINGTTILDAQGVANIPLAGSNSLGIVKIGNGLYASSAGNLYTNKASDVNIKAGNEDYKPIVSSNQHKSVFYALAKLAGADMSSSSNAIGNFTPEAIVAIQKMLGIPNMKSEVINTYTTNEDTSDLLINFDSNGLPFNLRVAKILVNLPPTTTGTQDYLTARLTAVLDNDTNDYVTLPTLRWYSSMASCLFTYEIETYEGLYFNRGYVSSGFTSSSLSQVSLNQNKLIKSITGIRFNKYSESSSLIPAGTVITIIGIRAY